MKYTSWAFQNRAGNIAPTSSYIFMILWSLVKIMKNHDFGHFWKKQHVLHDNIKIDLDVSEIFPARFWKAQNQRLTLLLSTSKTQPHVFWEWDRDRKRESEIDMRVRSKKKLGKFIESGLWIKWTTVIFTCIGIS